MNWRVWVLVACFGAAVVAGAFLLPRGNGSDAPLAAAARRTRAGPGYRLTLRGLNGNVWAEEYQAPNRTRTSSKVDGRDFQTVTIGDTSYGPASCTSATGTVTGYTTQHLERGQTIATGVLMLQQAEVQPAAQAGDGVYEFMVQPVVPKRFQRRLHVTPIRVDAHIDHGKVRELVMHWRQEHRPVTIRGTFNFDRVPEITAPAGPPLDMTHCSIGFSTGS